MSTVLVRYPRVFLPGCSAEVPPETNCCAKISKWHIFALAMSSENDINMITHSSTIWARIELPEWHQNDIIPRDKIDVTIGAKKLSGKGTRTYNPWHLKRPRYPLDHCLLANISLFSFNILFSEHFYSFIQMNQYAGCNASFPCRSWDTEQVKLQCEIVKYL